MLQFGVPNVSPAPYLNFLVRWEIEMLRAKETNPVKEAV